MANLKYFLKQLKIVYKVTFTCQSDAKALDIYF